MDQPRTDETLREFLDRRERELAQQIRELRALLAPKQSEFAEVRRTKATLGIAAVTSLGDMVGTLDELDSRMLTVAVREVPLQDMTIKDLIVRALVDHFRQGATPAELGDYIHAEYGRMVDPGSIRPNLGRLRDAGVIIHDGLASRWILNPAAAGTLLLHFASAEDRELLKQADKLAWTGEDDEAHRQYEANERAGMPQDDVHTWAAKRIEEKLAKRARKNSLQETLRKP